MKPRLVLVVWGAALWTPSPCWAHAVGVECSLKSGKVVVEAFFEGDAPAGNTRVEVRDDQEKIIAAGTTDKEGLWSFPAPPAGKYLVTVDAGMGHRATVAITVPDANEKASLGTSSPQQIAASHAAAEHIISEGTSRKNFTSSQYLKAGLGVGSIFLFTLAYLIARKKKP